MPDPASCSTNGRRSSAPQRRRHGAGGASPRNAAPNEVTSLEGATEDTFVRRVYPAQHPQRTAPQLLVSVRSVEEARSALAGGCDILDVKEPARGSLGMADIDVIERVAAPAAREVARGVPVSAALGETTDWLGTRVSPISAVPPTLAFVKLGLSSLGTDSGWIGKWLAVRRRFDQRAGRKLAWIAVAYADWRQARCPSPQAIVEAAIETSCRGALFDTFRKNGVALPELLHVDELTRLAESVRSAGLLLAVAGGLTIDHLAELCSVPTDVVAIRGAACEGQRRTASVSAAAVARFRAALEGVWP